jgi:hypothetical protein
MFVHFIGVDSHLSSHHATNNRNKDDVPYTRTQSDLTPGELTTVNELLAWNLKYKNKTCWWFIRLHFPVERREIIGAYLDCIQRRCVNMETIHSDDAIPTDVIDDENITKRIDGLQKQLETLNENLCAAQKERDDAINGLQKQLGTLNENLCAAQKERDDAIKQRDDALLYTRLTTKSKSEIACINNGDAATNVGDFFDRTAYTKLAQKCEELTKANSYLTDMIKRQNMLKEKKRRSLN